MEKRTYLTALLHGKCPQCREGDIFTYKLTKIRKFDVMNEKCPHCSVRLEPEPGFYQGAMYVSYAFTVTFLVIIGVLLYFTAKPEAWVYITTVITFMVLVMPLNYRYSRILFLYFFGGLNYQG